MLRLYWAEPLFVNSRNLSCVKIKTKTSQTWKSQNFEKMYENRKIQSFVKNYFNQHEYLKDKDPDQVTSILVYDYLIQNGYEKVAQKLALDILKSQEFSSAEEFILLISQPS